MVNVTGRTHYEHVVTLPEDLDISSSWKQVRSSGQVTHGLVILPMTGGVPWRSHWANSALESRGFAAKAHDEWFHLAETLRPWWIGWHNSP